MADGTIAAYQWTSSIAGALSTQASFSTSSLAVGSYYLLQGEDDDSTWSTPITQQLAIQSTPPNPEEVIIDNRDATLSEPCRFMVSLHCYEPMGSRFLQAE